MAIPTASMAINVPPTIRIEIFHCWISGSSERQAAARSGRTATPGAADGPAGCTLVQSQYRLFDSMESCLRRPKYFMGQQVYFPLNVPLKLTLIECYFSLDESVIRELIGRRLVGKTRRDLDDISEQTMIPLASCRRQFDNLCAVMKAVEEAPVNLFALVKQKFLLPPELVRCYVGALFLNYHQIDVNTQSTVEDMALDVLLECANTIITNWSVQKCSLSFDSAIAHDMRDLKAALWNTQAEWLVRINNALSPSLRSKLAGHEPAILTVVKHALQIGSGLVNTREIRDLLVDIIDLVSSPLLQDLGLVDGADIHEFFKALQTIPLLASNLVQTHPRVQTSFLALSTGLARCTAVVASDLVPK